MIFEVKLVFQKLNICKTIPFTRQNDTYRLPKPVSIFCSRDTGRFQAYSEAFLYSAPSNTFCTNLLGRKFKLLLLILAAVKSSAFSTPSLLRLMLKLPKSPNRTILPSASRSGTKSIKASIAANTSALLRLVHLLISVAS